jgi:hypothetical protein
LLPLAVSFILIRLDCHGQETRRPGRVL